VITPERPPYFAERDRSTGRIVGNPESGVSDLWRTTAMSLPIRANGYSSYKENERSVEFELDGNGCAPVSKN
jgi:hypothetical protein